MMEKIVVQKIVKSSPNVAKLYFGILSAINNLRLTDREINVLAYIANVGLDTKQKREDFCKINDTTLPTIYNVVSKLKKMGMVTKTRGGTRLVSVLNFDYKKDIQLQIELKHG
jgi:DNA-binding MarR family transcriptional regulator